MGGNTELVNVVYLDNMTLELYHRLLDKHPNATTYRITCVAEVKVQVRFVWGGLELGWSQGQAGLELGFGWG